MMQIQANVEAVETMVSRSAKYNIGQIVKHRHYAFRGVIFDVDPTFSNTEDWWESIPEKIRPERDQPFYHVLAENDKSSYVAYVSEQNLERDDTGDPINHPQVDLLFNKEGDGYRLKERGIH